MTPKLRRLIQKYRSCTRKRRYDDKVAAEKAMAELRHKGQRGLNAYHCHHCKGWHVGHVPLRFLIK